MTTVEGDTEIEIDFPISPAGFEGEFEQQALKCQNEMSYPVGHEENPNHLHDDIDHDEPPRHEFWGDAVWCALIWLILVFFVFTWLFPAISHWWWIIVFDIPLYLVHLLKSIGGPSMQYMRQKRPPNLMQEHLDALVASPPSVTWAIEHYHEEKHSSGGPGSTSHMVDAVTHSETRVMRWTDWVDLSSGFDWNDFDNYPLIKFTIRYDLLPLRFMDSVSEQYYQDAKTKTLELTPKKDKMLKISESVRPASILPEGGPGRFLVHSSDLDWRFDSKVYALCCVFTLSCFYNWWFEKQCVRREFVVRKSIQLSQMFPYCFEK